MTKLVSAPFTITIEQAGTVVTRDFEFNSGDKISFRAVLKTDKKATIPDLHSQSVGKVIELLQGLLKP